MSSADGSVCQSPAALQVDRYHDSGPPAGVCPYVVTSLSVVDVGPVPLVVSPSLPAAVDLSVNHADDLPLNLSVSTTDAVRRLFQTASDGAAQPASPECFQRCRQQSDAEHLAGGLSVDHPPPAHSHVTGRGVLDSRLTTDALTQWSVRSHDNRFTEASAAGVASTGCTSRLRCGDVDADDSLRSLDVLSVAAALRSEMLHQRLTLSAACDAVTTTSSVSACQVRHCTY